MSKVRVYELAKELGLENKALLDLCEQLNITGKASHSNSLSDDEAERIRRFVIRRAVSDKAGGVREVRREGELMTEQRVGGRVIRRRKKADDELDAEPEGETIDLQGPAERELPTLAPDLAAERKVRNEALERANALFKNAEELSAEAAEGAAASAAEEAEAAAQAESISEEAVMDSGDAVDESSEGTLVDEADRQAEAEAESARLAEVRKRLDIRAPKVLGKIDLPVQAPKEATSSRETATDDAAGAGRGNKHKRKKVATVSESSDEGDRDGRDSKRRPKKKQVLSKKELVDYDGDREGWKGKREKKGGKRGRGDANGAFEADSAPAKVAPRVIKVDGEISVGELAKQMGLKAGEVIGKLMGLGIMANINQLIDFETATILAEEFGHGTQNVELDFEAMVGALTEEDKPEDLALRPPVVTVMGHVDHGKTSLLDCIRKTSVTSGEFGGITQHIGAYNVKLATGGSVTFLDTPGHEAFTAMRSRGAQITDIVVLVVAANDGVMPQTIEAINHAKAAGVPIIVAINKMDVEDANPDKVINQLSEHELVPEEWGGDTLVCRVSAHTKEGIDTLLESLHLQAEVLELKANADRPAVGTVIESKVDRGRGPVISVLVQNGTLRKGDSFVAGAVNGKVRALISDSGEPVEEAGPSIPVEVLGVSAPAIAGDDFVVMSSDSQARKIAEDRAQRRRRKELATTHVGSSVGAPLTLESFSQMVTDSVELKELPLIVKADVQGSVEAVADALVDLTNEEVRVKIIHKAVGAISENDVQLASASRAILVAFNVRPDSRAMQLIEQEGISVLYSRVIYDLVDSVNEALRGRMAPKFQEKTLGRVEVRQTFRVPKLGMVAGSYVTDGTIIRNSLVRVLRDGIVVHEGKLASLRRFKDDVREVSTGYECGIGLEGYSDIKDGDVLEVYKVEEIAP